MDQQQPTPARLMEVGRALRIADERARRLAAETGLSIREIEIMARAACARPEPKPVGRPATCWSDRLGFASDGAGPVPFHSNRSTIALRVVVERAADCSLKSDADAYRKIATGHGNPDWTVHERRQCEQALKDAVKASAPSVVERRVAQGISGSDVD